MMAQRPEKRFHDPLSAQAKLDRVIDARRRRRNLLSAAGESIRGDSGWYVLEVRTGCELTVQRRLEEEKVCAWVPLRDRDVRLRHKRKTVRRPGPIFDGYVLVNVVPSNAAFMALLGFKHVRSILGDSNGPLYVVDENMKKLNREVEGNLFTEAAKKRRQRIISEGATVEITDGPFSHFRALVKAYNGGKTARCIASLFGKEHMLNIPLDKLRKIG